MYYWLRGMGQKQEQRLRGAVQRKDRVSIWDWLAKQGVLKCMGCPLVPSIVLERETGCPSKAKHLPPHSLQYHAEMKRLWAVL